MAPLARTIMNQSQQQNKSSNILLVIEMIRMMTADRDGNLSQRMQQQITSQNINLCNDNKISNV